jgi:xylulokinase
MTGPDLFPPLNSSSAAVGEVTAAVAREWRLPAGLSVVAGATDMACTAVGSGILSEGERGDISLTTASPVLMPISGTGSWSVTSPFTPS